MILASITRIEKNALRLNEILSVLGRYGLADWFGNLPYDWFQKRLVAFDGQRLGGLTKEARIRLALIELGTTFIKLGQILSTREDLVGPTLATELKQLQDRTPPDPPEVVRQTVAAELGKPPEEVFQEFEAAAFASASIAQVHRARLPDGRRVIVKVQHAGIEGKVNCDLDLMMGLAEVLQKHVPQLRNYQPVATTRELRRHLRCELDFSSERRNLETFTRNFAEEKTVHFPSVYPELCSRRVLTVELLEGILVTNHEELHASGIDLNQVALRAADMYLEMIFRDGFYHADPHPGNFILLPGGVVGVLDFGMVGRMDEQLKDHLDTLLLAVNRGDSGRLTEWALSLGRGLTDLDRAGLQSEVSDFATELVGQSIGEMNISGAIERMTGIMRRYGLVMPPSVSLLIKTLVMLEGTARQLDPSFSLAEVLERYQASAAHTLADPQRWLRKMERSYRDWERLAKVLPESLADVLSGFRGGTIELKHSDLRLKKAVDRLAIGILSAALFLGAAQLLSRASQDTVGSRANGIGLVFLVAAVALALRLVRAIHKAEKEKDA
ncbi:MAG: ABC1 kinase family protein [Isosphaeraceae bacterium]